MHLFLDEVAGGFSVIDGIFLELAFASLVANGAIQRVIDQEGFQNGLAHLFGGGRTGIDFHTRGDGGGAGDGAAGSGRLVGQNGARDFWSAVGVENGFAVRADDGRAELDQAHAAIADDGQFGMIAIMGDVDSGQRAGLQHRGGLRLALPIRRQFGHFDLAAVHLDLDLLDRRRGFLFSLRHGVMRGWRQSSFLTMGRRRFWPRRRRRGLQIRRGTC